MKDILDRLDLEQNIESFITLLTTYKEVLVIESLGEDYNDGLFTIINLVHTKYPAVDVDKYYSTHITPQLQELIYHLNSGKYNDDNMLGDRVAELIEVELDELIENIKIASEEK